MKQRACDNCQSSHIEEHECLMTFGGGDLVFLFDFDEDPDDIVAEYGLPYEEHCLGFLVLVCQHCHHFRLQAPKDLLQATRAYLSERLQSLQEQACEACEEILWKLPRMEGAGGGSMFVEVAEEWAVPFESSLCPACGLVHLQIRTGGELPKLLSKIPDAAEGKGCEKCDSSLKIGPVLAHHCGGVYLPMKDRKASNCPRVSAEFCAECGDVAMFVRERV